MCCHYLMYRPYLVSPSLLRVLCPLKSKIKDGNILVSVVNVVNVVSVVNIVIVVRTICQCESKKNPLCQY